ncbi:hypothetical protein LTR97_007870 [Elasticomyces elasticus]|uniref:Uncharacterized protein n=1 Tax=Elasticomyces elasticus TaxID=574655 RepID=A0AAN7W478_9PEZI|nr:hypothetical protein LTR97_007870 [Elasticomyces elasticus]
MAETPRGKVLVTVELLEAVLLNIDHKTLLLSQRMESEKTLRTLREIEAHFHSLRNQHRLPRMDRFEEAFEAMKEEVATNIRARDKQSDTIQKQGKRIDKLESRVEAQETQLTDVKKLLLNSLRPRFDIGRAEMRRSAIRKLAGALGKDIERESNLTDADNRDDRWAKRLARKDFVSRDGTVDLTWIWDKYQNFITDSSQTSDRNDVVHSEQTRIYFAYTMVFAEREHDSDLRHHRATYQALYEWTYGSNLLEDARREDSSL